MVKQINRKDIFTYNKTSYIARYYSCLWLVLLYIALLVVNKGFFALPQFVYDVFLKDFLMSLIFLFPVLLWHVWSIIGTRNNVKFLEVRDNFLFIKFFGILKENSIQLNYSDIKSIEWSKDGMYHFVLNLKNGEQKVLRTEICDREKAFELIKSKGVVC